MKRILLFITSVLFILIVGNICFAESGQPTATIYIWDTTNGVWERAETEGGVYNNLRIAIFEGDDLAAVMQINQNGVSVSTFGLVVAGMTYGYNGTSWDRAMINQDDHFYVECDTNSDVNIYYDGNRAEVVQANADAQSATAYGLLVRGALYGYNGTSWDRLISNQDHHLYVETDTNSLVGIYEDGSTVDVEQGNAEGKAATLYGLVGENMLYGFNGTAWDRLKVDEMDNLWVITATNSVTQARNYFWDGSAWQMGLCNVDHNQIVETSTMSDVNIYYDGNRAVVRDGSTDNNATSEDGLITQSNSHGYDGTNWDRARVDVEGHFIVQTDSDSIIKRIIDPVTTYMTISQYEELAKRTTVYLTESQWDELRAHSTWYMTESQFDELNNSIDAIHTRLYEGTTVTYKIDNSTYVYRDVYGNGNFTVNFHVKSIGVYSQGGDSTITWDGGDVIKVWEGIPFGDVPIDETFDSPVTFTYTLTPPTTFSIYIRGREY